MSESFGPVIGKGILSANAIAFSDFNHYATNPLGSVSRISLGLDAEGNLDGTATVQGTCRADVQSQYGVWGSALFEGSAVVQSDTTSPSWYSDPPSLKYLAAPWHPIELSISEAVLPADVLPFLPKSLAGGGNVGLAWYWATASTSVGIQKIYGVPTDWDALTVSATTKGQIFDGDRGIISQ